MPAKKILSDCNVVVANAIAADHAKDYVVAMALYRTAIGILLKEMEHNSTRTTLSSKSKQHNSALKARVKPLLHRAEELQRYLDDKSARKVEKTQRDKGSFSSIKRQGKQETFAGIQNCAEGDNNHDDEGQTAIKQREWSFHFDIRFDMKSKIKTPNPAPASEEEGGENNNKGGPFQVMKLLRLLPIGGL